MATITISSKGWVVIPAEFRKKYNLRPGDQVRLVDYGGLLTIVPLLKNPVREAAGMLKGKTSLVQALLNERARDREREES